MTLQKTPEPKTNLKLLSPLRVFMDHTITRLILGLFIFVIFLLQAYQMTAFIYKGPRFTSLDGQELCLRVQILEAEITKKPFPCSYEREQNP